MSKPEKDVQDTAVVVRPKQQALDLADTDKMKNFWELSVKLSNSDAIPKQYQGKPANVLVAILMSHRLGMDLVPFMQTTYPVNGKIGYEGKLISAIINNAGIFKTRLKYESGGTAKEDMWCYVWALDQDGNKLIGTKVSYKMAQDNGWTEPKEQKVWKNGQQVGTKMVPSKWDTLTETMLQYRAVKFFGNQHCSDLILGMHLKEELEEIDTDRVTTDVTDSSVVSGAPTLLAPARVVVGDRVVTEVAPVVQAEVKVAPPRQAAPAKEAPRVPAEAPKKPVEAPKPPEPPKTTAKAPASPPKSEKAPIKSDTKVAPKPETPKPEAPKTETPKAEPSAYVEKLQQKIKEAGIDADVVPFLRSAKMLKENVELKDISDANAKFCVDNWPKLLLKVAEFKAKAKK